MTVSPLFVAAVHIVVIVCPLRLRVGGDIWEGTSLSLIVTELLAILLPKMFVA